MSFGNGASRSNCFCVAVSITNEYGALCGKPPGILQGLFNVRNLVNDGRVYSLAILQLLQVWEEGGHITVVHVLVKVLT